MEAIINQILSANINFLENNISILGLWITVLIFIATASTAILPFIYKYLENKFEEKIENKFKEINQKIDNLKTEVNQNIQTTQNLYIGTSRLFRNYANTRYQEYENLRFDNRDATDYVYRTEEFIITMINDFMCIAEGTEDKEYKYFYDNYCEKIKIIKTYPETLNAAVQKFTAQYTAEKNFVSRAELYKKFGRNNIIINNIITMLSFIYNEYGEFK